MSLCLHANIIQVVANLVHKALIHVSVFISVKTLEAANSLKRQRIKAEAINSDLSQRQRENVMAAFRKGFIKVLVVGYFSDFSCLLFLKRKISRNTKETNTAISC